MSEPLMQGKRRIMEKFDLDEVSLVDRPAQAPAVAVLEKREADGAPEPSTPEPGAAMSDDLTKARERISALEAELANLAKVAGMSDAERTHYNALDEDARVVFLGKSADERALVLDLAKSADPVVYKTADGVAIHKSAGELAIRLAKQADEQATELAKMRAERVDADLTKRAETELSHLPGTLDVHKATLAAIDSIADATAREGALALLKAADAQHALAFTPVGTANAPSFEKSAGASGAQSQLDELAKAHAKQHGVTEAEALVSVLDTPEGEALYNKARKR